MATIQLGRTKTANKLLAYAEKRATARSGVDCMPDHARAQMKATRELWGKNGGVQAHHVIQSFDQKDPVTAEQANEIGRQLAQEMAKGHEVVVYTHTDKDHIHNHIIINSVGYEDGTKYQAHGQEAIDRFRDVSDRLCRENGLSVVEEKTAAVRYTLAEKALVEKQQLSWKDEIREKIDVAKGESTNFDDFKRNLLERHGIELIERGKNTTYLNVENGKRVRGNKLGESYEKETIADEFKEHERATSDEFAQRRGDGAVPGRREETNQYGTGRADDTLSAVAEDVEGPRTYRDGIARPPETGRVISVGTVEGEHAERDGDHDGVGADRSGQQGASRTDDFDLEAFNRRLEERKRGLKEGYRQTTPLPRRIDGSTEQRLGEESRSDETRDGTEQGDDHEQVERDRAEQQTKHGRDKSFDLELGPES